MRLAPAVAGLFLVASCQSGSDDAPALGRALELGNRAVSSLPVAPEELLLTNQMFLRNESDEPVSLQRVEPLNPDGPGEVLDIRLGLRADPPVPSSYYKTLPPVMEVRRRGPCGTERVVSVRGHVLESGEEARLIAILRVGEEPGRFRVRGWRIFYRQGDRDLYQDSPFQIALRVRDDRRPREFFLGERPCLHMTTPLEEAFENG